MNRYLLANEYLLQSCERLQLPHKLSLQLFEHESVSLLTFPVRKTGELGVLSQRETCRTCECD